MLIRQVHACKRRCIQIAGISELASVGYCANALFRQFDLELHFTWEPCAVKLMSLFSGQQMTLSEDPIVAAQVLPKFQL